MFSCKLLNSYHIRLEFLVSLNLYMYSSDAKQDRQCLFEFSVEVITSNRFTLSVDTFVIVVLQMSCWLLPILIFQQALEIFNTKVTLLSR